MDKIQILQQFLEDVGKKPYQGVYLFKYIIYEMTSGIIMEYQETERNSIFQKMVTDDIPIATNEKIRETEQFVEGLKEKDILFHLPSLRRYYKGKLEHTAGDAYIQCLKGK